MVVAAYALFCLALAIIEGALSYSSLEKPKMLV